MAHEPTPENAGIVMALAACGRTQEEIATYLRIDVKTLIKYYRPEIRNGLSIVTSQVAGKLMQAAMAGQPWAVCFFLKTRAGWKETHDVNIAGDSGVTALPDEEIAERRARLAAIESAAKPRPYTGGGATKPTLPR